MKDFLHAANTRDVQEGEPVICTLKGREIAIFKIEDAFFAVDNICPHMGGPIGEGEVKGDLVTCPWHEWSFNIKTGICSINPAACLETFPVRVEGERILIEL